MIHFALHHHRLADSANKSLTRQETIIINRLRIGYTCLTHCYLLSGDGQPTCSTYGHPLTVRHICCWTVLIYKMSDEDTSLLPVSEICLKLLTIVLLILSKTSVLTAYY